MFQYLELSGFDVENQCNHFMLHDTCFKAEITTPYSSPDLLTLKGNWQLNALTLYAVLYAYERRHLYVPTAIVDYYEWLLEDFNLTADFVNKQFKVIDRYLHLRLYRAYGKTVLQRLKLHGRHVF